MLRLPTDRLQTVIRIAAPPARVWQVLTDFAAYGDWNPFIRQIAGDAVPGARLTARMHPAGRRAMTFRPVVMQATAPHVLEWQGRLPVPGLYAGRHLFRLVADGPDTILHHDETFRGLLVPFLRAEGFRADFEAMNAALKARAEVAA